LPRDSLCLSVEPSKKRKKEPGNIFQRCGANKEIVVPYLARLYFSSSTDSTPIIRGPTIFCSTTHCTEVQVYSLSLYHLQPLGPFETFDTTATATCTPFDEPTFLYLAHPSLNPKNSILLTTASLKCLLYRGREIRCSMPQTTIPPLHTDVRSNSTTTTSSSSSSVNGDSSTNVNTTGLQRPKLQSRKSSGTIIVPREHPRVELEPGDEVFDEDDARAMSPRRSSQDLEKMSQDARAQLNECVLYPSSYHEFSER
jgi:hypothetical protein